MQTLQWVASSGEEEKLEHSNHSQSFYNYSPAIHLRTSSTEIK